MKNLKLLMIFFLLILPLVFFLLKKANAQTEYIIKFEQQSNSNTYLIKKDKLFSQCILSLDDGQDYTIWGDKCKFVQMPRENFSVSYTNWMSLEEELARFYGRAEVISSDLSKGIYYDTQGNKVTYEDWYEKGSLKRKEAIAKIGTQHWHTYKFNVQELTSKYKNKTPEGKALGTTIGIGIAGLQFPSLTPSLEDKSFIITLTILDDGTLKQDVKYEWKDEYKAML